MSAAEIPKKPRRWKKAAIGLTVAAVVLLGLVALVVAAFEERLIFYPSRRLTVTPAQLGLSHEELRLATSDGEEIHGYYITPPGGGAVPRAHLLFSHGNGGNVSGRLDLAGQLAARGLAVLVYDYRGYGRSSDGSPTEEGVYRDAEAAYAALLERAGGPERVVLYGRSLGGGVTWEMASRHPEVAGVITDATFTSIPDMAGELVFAPLAPFVRTRMDNRRRVAEVELPKLLLHGTDDELIPFRMGEELHRAARPPARLVPLPGAGHNDTFLVDRQLYLGAISDFVDRVVPPT